MVTAAVRMLIVLEDDDLREHSAHWEAGAKQKLHRTAEADTGSADVGEEETQCEPIST